MKKMTRAQWGGVILIIAMVILAVPITGYFSSDDEKKPVATAPQPKDIVSASEMEPSEVVRDIFTKVGCGYQEYGTTYASVETIASCTTGDLALAEFSVTAYRTRAETVAAFAKAKENCTRPFIEMDHAIITGFGEGALSITRKIQQKLGKENIKVECNN